ncbi:MAG: hydrogenase iron-sulfur subunit [Theionarchaea archaeon]|nr:hydrogenase iron-sulfur subunit [Theionarchaea archaeon]MBU7001741.1 hydrogenase iron-sulfur subunit [Theionarchaea archaeon]MBU7034393.1 hydrogenase iron-sulfur subunit [Theionarchaea archaeon]
MIGVFLCDCGTNIAGNMDMEYLKKELAKEDNLIVHESIFLCSQLGQDLIKETIEKEKLDRVVICSCSPKHHGDIFKECIGEKMNPYLWEMANIREQCSWATDNKEEATQKALALIKGAIEASRTLQEIGQAKVPVIKDVMVIGGGIAGMHAALEVADKGFHVHLVEQNPNIGGNMCKLDRTFPTDDCSMCTISPILNETAMHKNIDILTMTDVEDVSGHPGEYIVTVRSRPRYVDFTTCTGCGDCAKTDLVMEKPKLDGPLWLDRIKIHEDLCNGCGACAKLCAKQNDPPALTQKEKDAIPEYDTHKCVGCWVCVEKCPKKAIEITNVCPIVVPSEFNLGLGFRKAIYVPDSQAVPLKYLRDPETCLQLNGTMDCQGCTTVCKAKAPCQDTEEVRQLKVGAIVVATGYEQYDLSGTEYNLEHPNVITGLELERLISPSGPTLGELKRPSDGKIPQTVVFIQCAGSRDRRYAEYCSKICCMYATKNARLIKADHPEIDVTICYIDLRAAGRGYEEYFDQAREMGIRYIRGNVSEVLADGDQLLVRTENTLLNEPLLLEADLVVLSTALVPSQGTKHLIETIPLVPGKDGFIAPVHVKIAPVDTATTGIFIAGTAEAPKPIQECITDAGAVASRVATFLKDDQITVDLVTSHINPDICIKCGECNEICNYDAIDTEGDIYEVVDVACHACGMCTTVCPTNAIELRYFSDIQLEKAVDGILEKDRDSVIAYCCSQCGYNAADLAGTAKMRYSPEVKIVRVPCSGRVTIPQMLYPFTKGAKGVMIGACLEGQCHYIDGNIKEKEKVALAKQILDLMGIGGEKLELFNISSAEGAKFVESAEKMVSRC